LKLSEKDFNDLVACPLTYEGYLDILKRKGFVSAPCKTLKIKT